MSAVIFNGDVVKALKDGIKLGSGATIYTANIDPTVTPAPGVAGDILISTLTAQLYIKADSGMSTNWGTVIQSSSALDPNEVVVTDGSGNLATSLIVNAYVDAAAAIAYSKLANLGGATDRILTQSSSAKVQADASILSTDLILKGGSVAFTANQSMGGNKLTSLANGTVSADAVNYSQLQAVQSLIEAFTWFNACLDREVDPPLSPSTGDRYLIDAVLGPATGAWTGQEDSIAEWNGSSWVFTAPLLGAYVAINNESDGLYLYGGSSWSKKYFEATTASTGLVKVGFDVRLDASSAGDGLDFSGGVLSVLVDGSTLEINADTLRVKPAGITDNEISATADIDRTKLLAGTADHVVINDAGGVLSSEAQLAVTRGGTGLGALGTANQLLTVDPAGTDLEYKTLSTGTSGTDFAIAHSAGSTVLNLPVASGTNTGKLSAADWTTFNNKQDGGAAITDLTGDVTATGPGSVTATIEPNVVTDSKLRQSAALSVIGRSANSTGDVADISAGTADHVLRRSGTTLGFGTLVDASIDAAAAIARTKLASGTADHVVINNGSGVLSSEAQLSISRGGTALATTPTNGQLLIGNGTNYTLATLTAGAGISVTNGAGTITVASTAPSPSSGDIPETSFSIANNQAVLSDVTGFLFNPASVRSFNALVSILVDSTTDYAEVMEIVGINKPLGGWAITTRRSGDASQVELEIDNTTGQLQYTSGNYAGFISGTIKFRAITTSV